MFIRRNRDERRIDWHFVRRKATLASFYETIAFNDFLRTQGHLLPSKVVVSVF